MKKKNLSILFIIIFIMAFLPKSSLSADQSEVKLLIDGKYVESDVKPLLENGRVLVPIRVISEELGYKVDWDEKQFCVTISDFDENNSVFNKLFILTIDNKKVLDFESGKINKLFLQNPTDEMLNKVMKDSLRTIDIDVPPRLIEKRTYVPIRVVAELMGKEINWDLENWTVIIGETADKR